MKERGNKGFGGPRMMKLLSNLWPHYIVLFCRLLQYYATIPFKSGFTIVVPNVRKTQGHPHGRVQLSRLCVTPMTFCQFLQCCTTVILLWYPKHLKNTRAPTRAYAYRCGFLVTYSTENVENDHCMTKTRQNTQSYTTTHTPKIENNTLWKVLSITKGIKMLFSFCILP